MTEVGDKEGKRKEDTRTGLKWATVVVRRLSEWLCGILKKACASFDRKQRAAVDKWGNTGLRVQAGNRSGAEGTQG